MEANRKNKMLASVSSLSTRKFILFLATLFVSTISAIAQAPKVDTADKLTIVIANTGVIEHFQTDSGSLNKFVTDVIVYQGTDTLYCDSLFQYVEKKMLEAFGSVRIAQAGGTEATCDYLRYTADKKLAYMTGNVSITDGKNNLWGEEITYDLGSKIGTYNNKGTLQSDSTILTSEEGVYYVNTHDARFTGNVVVVDPKYKVRSKDLGYNTETKVETFYDYSVVTSDSGKSILTTYKGTYDSKNVVALFSGHSSIWNDGQYIEADSMHYDKASGYGYALGNVISIDTAQRSTLFCGRADYFRKKRVLWAIINPVLQYANGKDTFYMRADTFYSAPMLKMPGTAFKMPVDSSTMKFITKDTATNKITDINKQGKQLSNDTLAKSANIINVVDSTWVIPEHKYGLTQYILDTSLSRATHKLIDSVMHKKKRHKKIPAQLALADTTDADTTAPVFFVGYHNAILFSDSMQAKCDSITITRSDTILRMYGAPVAWTRKSQISGDTILVQLDTAGIRSIYIPKASIMIAQSGPDQAGLYDQVQGISLTGFMKNNSLTKMIVKPEAQSIYYTKDDAGAYLGVEEASGETMRIFFGEEKISRIKYEHEVKQTLTPMEQADFEKLKLSRFKWRTSERPYSKEQIFTK